MRPGDDDFALFGLPRRFALDRADLDARRRALQSEVHPDRFASADPAARRAAMQSAVRVNEAYEHLKDPLARARVLCKLGGVTIDAEDNTAMPAAFLMQQMEWREAFDEAHDLPAVERVADELAAALASGRERLRVALDERGDTAGAAAEVRALMFIERFAGDVDERLSALAA